jgi:hypothetical protein
MHIRSLSASLAFVGLLAIACDDGTQEQSPGEVLARDSTLARGLQQADTSSFADDEHPLPTRGRDSLAGQPAPPPARPNTTSARPAPRRMRPAPATIHPDPLPGHPLPPAEARSSSSSNGASPRAKARAVEILQQVPGATLPSAVRPRGSGAP